MITARLKDFSWERMIAAVDAVRERARRIAAALDRAGIKHAVIGGNAIAAWVARVDVEAVRNTKDVDLSIRREDFERVIQAAQSVGFVYPNVAEWCNDIYDQAYYRSSPTENPRGPAEGETYVLRGGAWSSSAERLRCSARMSDNPGFADVCLARDAIGFRCVRRPLPAEMPP